METKFQNINLNYLKSLSDNNVEFEREIIEMFLKQLNEDIETIVETINSEDYLKASDLVHKLKGSFRMFGAKGADELQNIETLCKQSNVDKDFVLDQLKTLYSTIETTKEELKKALESIL